MLTVEAVLRAAAAAGGHLHWTGADGAGHTLPYSAVQAAVERQAAAWVSAAGTPVATWGGNDGPHLLQALALQRAGAIWYAVNHRLPAAMLAGVLEQVRPAAVVVLPGYRPVWEAVRDRLAAPPPEAEPGGDAPPGGLLPAVAETDPATLVTTSGTTGPPKAAVYPQRAIALHAVALAAGLGVRPGDVLLPLVPLFHVQAWGLPYVAFLQGADLVLAGGPLEPAAVSRLMADRGVTVAAGVPTVWHDLIRYWETAGGPPPGLRTAFTGGAPLPEALYARLTGWGVTVIEGYGLSEAGPSVALRRAGRGAGDSGDLGYPLPFVEVTVAGEDGQPLPPDGRSAGELRVRSPWTARPLGGAAGEGWIATGDVVVQHPDGRLHLRDRLADRIKSGGEWIDSLTLERRLLGHPAVAEAAVVACPDRRWGERPLAVVAAAAPVGEQELQAWLREVFPAWWVPDAIHFVAALPRTATGKVDKRALRAACRSGDA
ncbi:MAG: AMP-binding protein [Firmicutes bacterium]|nr:AMP-binding protein [Bacillota bacterium]